LKILLKINSIGGVTEIVEVKVKIRIVPQITFTGIFESAIGLIKEYTMVVATGLQGILAEHVIVNVGPIVIGVDGGSVINNVN
jgi:hypothetical protein